MPDRGALGANYWKKVAGRQRDAVTEVFRASLACPDDDAPLEPREEGKSFVCPVCARRYQYADGIIAILPSNDPYQLTEAERSALEAAAPANPWIADPPAEFGTLWNRMIDVLGPLDGKRILDAGAGSGWAGSWFAAQGAHVAAVDMVGGAAGLGEAASRDTSGRLDLFRADLARLPFSPETFDAVFISSVLHTMHRPERLMMEAARVLKPASVVVNLNEPSDTGIRPGVAGGDPRINGRLLSMGDYEGIYNQAELELIPIFEGDDVSPTEALGKGMKQRRRAAKSSEKRFFVGRRAAGSPFAGLRLPFWRKKNG